MNLAVINPWCKTNKIPTHSNFFHKATSSFVDFMYVGTRAAAFSVQINVGVKPAVAAGDRLLQDIRLLQKRTQPFKRDVCSLHLFLSIPPSHWCQKNLLSSQRGVRLPPSPHPQKKHSPWSIKRKPHSKKEMEKMCSGENEWAVHKWTELKEEFVSLLPQARGKNALYRQQVAQCSHTITSTPVHVWVGTFQSLLL